MRLAMAEVAEATGGRLVAGDGGVTVAGGAVDSRRVEAGNLFFALPGQRVDGHQFVGQALAAGARGAVIARPLAEVLPGGPPPGTAVVEVADTRQALASLARWVRRRRPGLRVVGITGSVGKTTTKEMTAAVLEQRFAVLKTAGNYNTDIGLPLILLDLEDHHQVAVLEMAMRGLGEIARLASIAEPDIGVVTVVAESHLEFLGSLEKIAQAKGELVEALPADGVAILNAGDPRVRAMAARTRARVLTFGVEGGADVRAVAVESRGPGTRFRLEIPGGDAATVELALPGPAAVTCALAAAAVGVVLGLDADAIAAGLGRARPASLRSEIRQAGSWTLFIDCYNASPTSTAAALQALRQVAGDRRAVAILGDMFELGDWAEEGHRRTGQAAARSVDVLLAVGRWAPALVEGWRQAGGAAGAAAAYPDKAALLADLDRWLHPGDAILIKGSRGMAMEEVAGALLARAGAAGSAPGAEG
ncbi:UDP-N-acetylmuramoyl-tripeptide--D-alanyl-D-alanine ligase [Thermaerobacter subterraneus]|uniref:UDP-N-acetylmuramoyl-tripeptide--D-alanyl-D-alanine ligase n=1 Tax=Thermaerobacter subterraneus DSM 13965 TaxID=867903 RepID=K6PSG0_9FIRM|nr:UDP-N-acetylmuramoyl-tripeptide--D-alanyl-D-alanine ligase [Thermaerobacter subterraneus]EKP95902.1 UDP-N-acetylmuramoyl-tripeptide--D-alanyl-D-alanine ligase [Thermaerobacter subterraneus DSM 13965]